jgi:hypothetical protein
MGISRSVIVTVIVALLVVAGALGGAAYLRMRSEAQATPSSTAPPPPAATTCHAEPCHVLASASVGSTQIDLVADAGDHSGRLRIGDLFIESTITDRGAVLTGDSLQCVAGATSACLIRGDLNPGGKLGEVVVGRSGKWQLTAQPYLSNAGYLALTDVTGEGTPEVIVAQRGFYVQVFPLDGGNPTCTKPVAKLTQLPGWPTVKPPTAQLKPCS